MKTITSILATAALLTGIAVAGAQTSESQKTLDSAGGAERNPDGSAGESKTHPSPGGTTVPPASRPTPGRQALRPIRPIPPRSAIPTGRPAARRPTRARADATSAVFPR